MAVGVRKIQVSKTGLYITIPVEVKKELKLNGSEYFKFTTTQDGKIVMEIIKM